MRDAVTQTDKIDGSKPSILKRKTGGRVTGAKHTTNEQTSNRTSMSMNSDTRTTKIKSRPRSSGWNSSPRLQRPGYERSIRTDEPFFDIMSSLKRPTSASSSITLNETNTSPTLTCELKNTTISGINAPAENNKSSTNNIDKPRAFEKTTLVTSRRNDGLISRLKNSSVTNTSGTSLSKSETSIPGSMSSTNNDHIKSTRSLSASRVESKQQAFGLASDSPVLIKNRQERDRLQRSNQHSVTAISSSSSSQP